MKVKCEYCGSMIDDQAPSCPNCGAPNANMKRTVDRTPKTIEELKAWYQARHLPPYETTRFFIGIDYKQPKAFGIYKEPDGTCVVYKNKADGSRAVRYRGNDEAYAVNELFLKLKSEILNQKALNQRRGGGSRAGSSSCMSPILKWFAIVIAVLVFLAAAFVNPLPAVIAAAVPAAAFFIVRAFRKAKGLDNGKLTSAFPIFYIIYVIIMSIAVIVVTPAHRANYYSYNKEIYAEYDDNYYLYDPILYDYTPIDGYYVPEEIVSHPEDYEFNSENIQWDSNYEFENSNYYENNIEPEESYHYDNDNDSDWDWDSGDSWDSGGSDWGSDW